RPPTTPPLFPYTTLFRSPRLPDGRQLVEAPHARIELVVRDDVRAASRVQHGNLQLSIAIVDERTEIDRNRRNRQGERFVHLRSRSEEHTSELQSLAYLVC